MIDLTHLGLSIGGIVVFLAVSFYCFRLINKFFKGGIFGDSFKAFMGVGGLVATALVVDLVVDVFEPEPLSQWLSHIFHMILEILAGMFLLYGVHQLYKAWTKLG